MCLKLKECLECAGLYIAPDKLQYTEPFQYLGNIVTCTTIKPQKLQVCRDSIKTLNDLQKLLGDINWIWPNLGIPTYSLSHLFSLLRGNPELNSSWQLTPEAEKELTIIEQAVQNCQIDRIDPLEPFQLFVFLTPHSPTGLIMQTPLILEWIFLANSQTKSFTPYLDMIAII